MAESSASTSDRPGPSKKAKRDCRYQQDWRSHGMLPSARGPTFACCKYCNTDINVAHEGVSDIKKHLTTSKHREIINTLHAMGPYMGPTGRTHGKAKVTFSRWYSSKIVDCQQLIDYLAL